MPFTPFHLGPALFIGAVLRLNMPTLLVASVLPDIEPLVVLALGLSMPLHGLLHTFLGTSFIGVLFYLLIKNVLSAGSRVFASSLLGVYIHVIFDSPLYADIKPFYPLDYNPLYGSISASGVYTLCVLLFIAGAVLHFEKS